MNAHIHFLAPCFPSFKIDTANGATAKNDMIHFHLNYGCEWLELKIQAKERHVIEYKDMSIDSNPDNYNPAPHWIFELTDSRIAQVVSKSSDFIQVGNFIELTLNQVTELRNEIDALNEDRFEQMNSQEIEV